MWCRSAHTHRLDAALNKSLRLVSGCIRSTPTVMLLVVIGITPPDIRRNKQCLALVRLAETHDQHTLVTMVTTTASGCKCLRSRHAFSEHTRCIISDAAGKSSTTWTNEARRASAVPKSRPHFTSPVRVRTQMQRRPGQAGRVSTRLAWDQKCDT